jgi:hypothetical protein
MQQLHALDFQSILELRIHTQNDEFEGMVAWCCFRIFVC